MRIKVMLSVLVLFSLVASCNLQTGQTPSVPSPSPEGERVSSEVELVGTAVQLTTAAQLTGIAGSATVTFTASPTFTSTPPATAVPTQCSPLVTANVVANIRSGPDTAYDVVGTLQQGQTAAIAGRNDASTWWYIDHPAGSGNHAWIAGSVTTAACLPATVQVVAAPPLPTSAPQAAEEPAEESGSSGTPDLVAAGMQYYVVSGKTVHVMVRVTNTGNGKAGGFSVRWWANQNLGGCDWQVQGLGAGKSKDLECDYKYEWGANDYWSVLLVDSGSQVSESDEGNNKKDYQVKLQ